MKLLSTSVLTAACLLAPARSQQPGPKPETSPSETRKDAPRAQTKPTADDDPVMSMDRAILAIDQFIGAHLPTKEDPAWRTKLTAPPKLAFDPKREYHWILETSKGSIDIELMPGVAPQHVSSTLYLARLGFYDGLLFHRVIPGFMAQGGCPLGNGTGNPGYGYEGEFDAAVKHDRPGLLSMANAGPGTDGSQFFLTFVATPHLNGNHTIFGEIVRGMDVLKALGKAGTSPAGQPSEPLRILRTRIAVVPVALKSEAKADSKGSPAAGDAKAK